jgi:hypothetical protein
MGCGSPVKLGATTATADSVTLNGAPCAASGCTPEAAGSHTSLASALAAQAEPTHAAPPAIKAPPAAGSKFTRLATCSDIPPDTTYTCAQQVRSRIWGLWFF